MSHVKNERDVILENAIQRIETQAPKDVSLSGRGVVLEINTITKETGQEGWNAEAFSLQNSTGSAYVSATAPQANKELVFGLNEDPGTNSGHNTLDFAWHLHANGTISIVENGQMINFSGGAATNPGGTEGEDTTTPDTGADSGSPPNKIIHWYGDSFTWGWDGSTGARVSVPVPQYVDGRTNGADITNFGVNSATLGDALAGSNVNYPPWANQMDVTTSDWVVIAFMYNDAWKVTTQTYRDQLRRMYTLAKDNGKTVVFQTCHYTDPALGDISSYVNAMKAEAVALGIRCIDVYSYTKEQFTGNIRDWVPDGYHPTQTAYNIIGEFLVNQFLSFMPGLTAAGTGGGVGGGGDPLPPPPATDIFPQSGTIAYFGESVTYGMRPEFAGRSPNQIPSKFDDDLSNFTVANEGVTDKTTARILNGDYVHPPLDTWLQTNKPTYLILQIGIYEHHIDGGTSASVFKSNLEQIVDRVRAAGIVIIFQTSHETSIEAKIGQYRAAFDEVAEAKDVPKINLFDYSYNYRTSRGLTIMDMCPDGVHPSDATYVLYGAYCADSFKRKIGAV